MNFVNYLNDKPLLYGCSDKQEIQYLLLLKKYPIDIVVHVLSFLQIDRASNDQIVKIKCSSKTDFPFPLEEVLSPSKSTWWISASDTMPCGEGSEYLEFSFGSTLKLISKLYVSIPPLPQGPLSVRVFHLMFKDEDTDSETTWKYYLHPNLEFETRDTDEVQEFILSPPIEAKRIRMVCTRNAAAPFPYANCVGLYQVEFK